MSFNFRPTDHSQDSSHNLCNRPTVESFWFEILQTGERRPCACGSICQMDKQEIYEWSADYSELLGGLNAFNVSYHPLPSGRYCLSRTFYASDFRSALHDARSSNIYSNRQTVNSDVLSDFYALRRKATFDLPSVRMFTHAWVFQRPTLQLFGYHPLSLYRALRKERIGYQVTSDGYVSSGTPTPNETVRSMVRTLSRRNQSALPSGEFDALLEQSASIVVYGKTNLLSWFDRQITTMPVQQRAETTFCTSLKLSDNRPFLLTGIGKSSKELRRVRRQYNNVPVWDIRRFVSTSTENIKPFKDSELIQLWECFKESLWGNRTKYLQGVRLWNEYRTRHSSTADSALESLLQWSIDAYRGLDAMQAKHTEQVHAMVDMLDALLK